MRFDASSILLGLAALSNLPAGSGRVLYGYDSAADLDQLNNVTHLDARVVIPPVKPPIPVKPKPVVAPEPIVPGGDRAPLLPNGDKGPSEPVPLLPADKPDPAVPADKPDPAVPVDKNPAPPADKSPDDVSPAGKADEDTPELFCPADLLNVLKRNLHTRALGGSGCGSRRTPRRTDDEIRSHYESRGRRAGAIEARPRQYDNVDYAPRIRDRYTMERQSTPEESIEDFMPRTGYSRDHGFSERPGDWETHSTYSGTGDNRGSEPVSQISYARSGDHAAYVAHQRWAERDSNRWQLNSRGDNIRDADDNFVPAADWQRNTVPVSNLVHEGSRRSGHLNPPPRRISMMSENIANQDGQRAIDMAFRDLGPRESRLLVRRDSTGLERTHYDRLSGVENNYSYRNTVGRNRDYDDYDHQEVEVWPGPEYAMSSNYYRRN